MNTTITEIENTNGTWLFLAPIRNLQICAAVNFECKINQVIFVDASKLYKRRIKYGFAYPISDIKKRYKGFVDQFFSEEKTFATLRLTGKGKDLKQRFITQINDALAIISLSQLGYSRRRHNASPALSKGKAIESRSFFMLNLSNDRSYKSSEITGKFHTLHLDDYWCDFQKNSFFYDLVKIISGQTRVAPKWRKDITNAAILAGQSQSGQDIPQCFLWNIIALETLLTQSDDKYSKKLPERTEAFIGWSKDWTIDNFEAKIKEMYEKRCIFVHTGRRDHINIEDILFSDDMLLNVLLNIVRHPNIFGSKENLIEFSKKIQAEHVLGIKSKIRPKTFTLLRPRYIKEDLENI